jgi:GrpB-like predicted nucleotidyltransferase (UPF0157 family)
MAEEIEIAEYDARWPARFATEVRQFRRLLGMPSLDRASREHCRTWPSGQAGDLVAVNGARVCHVHLMLRRHAVWTRLVAFRDHLRTHPDVACEYADLKRSPAGTLGHDRRAYMSEKGDFIARITDVAMREGQAQHG